MWVEAQKSQQPCSQDEVVLEEGANFCHSHQGALRTVQRRCGWQVKQKCCQLTATPCPYGRRDGPIPTWARAPTGLTLFLLFDAKWCWIFQLLLSRKGRKRICKPSLPHPPPHHAPPQVGTSLYSGAGRSKVFWTFQPGGRSGQELPASPPCSLWEESEGPLNQSARPQVPLHPGIGPGTFCVKCRRINLETFLVSKLDSFTRPLSAAI